MEATEGYSLRASGSIVQKPGCWIDIFELSHYRGRRRRLFGPSAFHSLRCRLPAWGISMDSAIIGPGAYVRLFPSADPHLTSLWLVPDQRVGDMLERIPDEVDSIQILPEPPKPGESGYEHFRFQLQQADPGSIAPGSVNQPDSRGQI
jgi:hypothetical protein